MLPSFTGMDWKRHNVSLEMAIPLNQLAEWLQSTYRYNIRTLTDTEIHVVKVNTKYAVNGLYTTKEIRYVNSRWTCSIGKIPIPFTVLGFPDNLLPTANTVTVVALVMERIMLCKGKEVDNEIGLRVGNNLLKEVWEEEGKQGDEDRVRSRKCNRVVCLADNADVCSQCVADIDMAVFSQKLVRTKHFMVTYISTKVSNVKIM